MNQHKIHKPRSLLMVAADDSPMVNLPLFRTDIATFNENNTLYTRK